MVRNNLLLTDLVNTGLKPCPDDLKHHGKWAFLHDSYKDTLKSTGPTMTLYPCELAMRKDLQEKYTHKIEIWEKDRCGVEHPEEVHRPLRGLNHFVSIPGTPKVATELYSYGHFVACLRFDKPARTCRNAGVWHL